MFGHMKRTNMPSNIQSESALTTRIVLLAADLELDAAGLLPVLEAPPLPDCDGMVDGEEFPTLVVAFPSARRIT